RRALDLDPGYLSRILGRFEDAGIATRGRSEHDRRRQVVGLTRRGRSAFRDLDRRSGREVGQLLRRLDDSSQEDVVRAMRSIRGAFDQRRDGGPARLRAPRPGDLGWILERHGVLYAREHGWNDRAEALMARVVADFAESHDPDRERAWMRESGAAAAGRACAVRSRGGSPRLRFLWVNRPYRPPAA